MKVFQLLLFALNCSPQLTRNTFSEQELVEAAKLDLSNSTEHRLFLRDKGPDCGGEVLLDTVMSRGVFEQACIPIFFQSASSLLPLLCLTNLVDDCLTCM